MIAAFFSYGALNMSNLVMFVVVSFILLVSVVATFRPPMHKCAPRSGMSLTTGTAFCGLLQRLVLNHSLAVAFVGKRRTCVGNPGTHMSSK